MKEVKVNDPHNTRDTDIYIRASSLWELYGLVWWATKSRLKYWFKNN